MQVAFQLIHMTSSAFLVIAKFRCVHRSDIIQKIFISPEIAVFPLHKLNENLFLKLFCFIKLNFY